MDSFFDKVYDMVKCIPLGKVVTYGDIARALGNSRMSRQVGFALHANPYFGSVPCHRVVNRFGQVAENFAFGGGYSQRALLEREGIVLYDNRVELSQYRHIL